MSHNTHFGHINTYSEFGAGASFKSIKVDPEIRVRKGNQYKPCIADMKK